MSILTNCAKSLRRLSSITLNPVRFASSAPRSGGRDKCMREDNDPPCSAKKLEEKKATMPPPPKSMWENPDCCIDPCKDYLPRFDDLYYKPTDKAKRKYTRTWCECPPIKIMPKKICCFERIQLPPIVRRKKPECPKTACSVEDQTKGGCTITANKRCIKIRIPGCCPVRDPPRCGKPVARHAARCRKICTPYPAYSECSRKPGRPLRPVECTCHYAGPTCSAR